jgi:hypothetical protein
MDIFESASIPDTTTVPYTELQSRLPAVLVALAMVMLIVATHRHGRPARRTEVIERASPEVRGSRRRQRTPENGFRR